jgi:hypothetical protein
MHLVFRERELVVFDERCCNDTFILIESTLIRKVGKF